MTGKEALEYIIKLVLSHTSTGRHSGKSYTQKALYKLSEELELLTKYKGAFDILKSTNKITIQKVDWHTMDYLLRVDDLGFKLTQEEYELLEELMNNENS